MRRNTRRRGSGFSNSVSARLKSCNFVQSAVVLRPQAWLRQVAVLWLFCGCSVAVLWLFCSLVRARAVALISVPGHACSLVEPAQVALQWLSIWMPARLWPSSEKEQAGGRGRGRFIGVGGRGSFSINPAWTIPMRALPVLTINPGPVRPVVMAYGCDCARVSYVVMAYGCDCARVSYVAMAYGCDCARVSYVAMVYGCDCARVSYVAIAYGCDCARVFYIDLLWRMVVTVLVSPM